MLVSSDKKKMILSFILIMAAVFLLAGSSGVSGYMIARTGGTDTTPPTIQIISPADGSEQLTNVPIDIQTNDASGHYAFTSMDGDLALWMRMDDVSHTGPDATVFDGSGSGNDGTAYGDAAQADGLIGKGFTLDGDGDYIEVIPLQIVQGQFTVSAWAKLAMDDGASKIIVGTRGPGGDSSFDFKFDCDDGVQYTCIHGDIGDGTDWLTTSADAPFNSNTDTWYHIVYVVNRTGYTIYADGNEIASDYSTYDGNPLLFDTTGDHHLFIGQVGYSDEFFNGTIDDVLIFNRTLSREEVKSLYDANANQYKHTFTGLPLGSHTLKAYAADVWGNRNSKTATFTVVNEITIPKIFKPIPEVRVVQPGPDECFRCPPSTDWSACSDGKETRTTYDCASTTAYRCVARTEENACESPAAPVTQETQSIQQANGNGNNPAGGSPLAAVTGAAGAMPGIEVVVGLAFLAGGIGAVWMGQRRRSRRPSKRTR